MRTLTLTQPWATLVAIGAKRIETRSWGTSYRGPLAIHAAKGLGSVGGPSGLIDICLNEPFMTAMRAAGKGFLVPGQDIPLGAIVAVTSLIDVMPTEDVFKPGAWPGRDTPEERAFGDYSPGRFAWVLGKVVPIREPIHVRGMMGLWDWDAPADVLAAVAGER